MQESGITKAIGRIENVDLLDPVVAVVRSVVNTAIRQRWLRDLLHGVPVGHPVHPFAVHIPLGAWTSAAILDAFPGTARASRILVGVGAIAAVPAALSGYVDWSDLHPQQMRVGVLHSFGNATATMLYTASFVQRRRGKSTSAKALGYLGLAVVGGAGFLGSHLSYRQAAGANHTEDVPHRFPQGWQPLAPLDELPDGVLSRQVVAELPLLVLRRGERVDVLSGLCSHLSGPLVDGVLSGVGGQADESAGAACVSCPWHGSTFSIETGEVVHGPATAPQPKFVTRVLEGRVEVLLPGAQ